MENEKLDKDKKLLKMLTNKYNYEKLHEKAIDDAKFYLGRASIKDTASTNNAYRQLKCAIVIKKKLEKYQEIIENKYCDGISKERYHFLNGLFEVLKKEYNNREFYREDAVFWREIILSFEDQEYLEELRGYFKLIDKNKYLHDEEWINIEV